MPEQLETNASVSAMEGDVMTNTNVVVSDNADASAATDVTEQMLVDAQVAAMASAKAAEQVMTSSMVSDITTLFDSTLTRLIEMRDSAYAAAIAGLEAEAESEVLAREYAQLETSIKDIEATLPAKTRLTQHEADVLLVSNKPDAARDKLAELEVVKSELAAMRERCGIIQDSFSAIASEKEGAAKTVVEDWLAKVVRPVVKVSEHGLLVKLLSGLEQSLYSYGDSTGIKIHQGHISGLTADGRSEEYAAGRHWYR